jgi:hypothetical protein|nr:MAG TPA: putative methyltransferase [Caudoviricetes sp.]
MRINEAKQGEVVFAGDQAYKIIEKITSGVIVKNVETSAVFLVTEDVEVVSAEDKVQAVLNKFIDKVGEAFTKELGSLESDDDESAEAHSSFGEDEYDEEDEDEDDYDEEDADEELYHECVEEVVEDLKDNGLVEAGEAAENILLDTEARYNAAIVDAIAKIRMFRYSEDPELLDDIEETLFTLF